MDINTEIIREIEKMKTLGKTEAPIKGGNINNLLDYDACRRRILEKCLAAFEEGYRFDLRS